MCDAYKLPRDEVIRAPAGLVAIRQCRWHTGRRTGVDQLRSFPVTPGCRSFPQSPGFLRIEQLPWIWETPAPAIGSRFHTVPADSRTEGAFAPPVLAQPAGIGAKRTTLAEVPVLHWPEATPELMLTEVANVLQKLHSADSKFGDGSRLLLAAARDLVDQIQPDRQLQVEALTRRLVHSCLDCQGHCGILSRRQKRGRAHAQPNSLDIHHFNGDAGRWIIERSLCYGHTGAEVIG